MSKHLYVRSSVRGFISSLERERLCGIRTNISTALPRSNVRVSLRLSGMAAATMPPTSRRPEETDHNGDSGDDRQVVDSDLDPLDREAADAQPFRRPPTMEHSHATRRLRGPRRRHPLRQALPKGALPIGRHPRAPTGRCDGKRVDPVRRTETDSVAIPSSRRPIARDLKASAAFAHDRRHRGHPLRRLTPGRFAADPAPLRSGSVALIPNS